MLLNDKEIAKLANVGMIDDFIDHQVSDGVVSYGLSSFGYDMRVDEYWKVYRPNNSEMCVLDPKVSMINNYDSFVATEITMMPGDFVLCQSYERFIIPDDVLVVVVGKSTYARLGIIVNVTPLEPGWEGIVTIEISNTNTVPVRIHAFEGIAQCLFFKGNKPDVTYSNRQGRYNMQQGITLPFIRNNDE